MRGLRCFVYGLTVSFCLGSEAHTQDLDMLLDKAAEFKARGEWDNCIETLQGVVRRAPEDRAKAALAQCGIGEAYVSMGRPKEAEEALRKVKAGFPEQTESINWSRVALIDALTFQAKPEGALKVFAGLQTAYKADEALPLQYAWGAVKAAGLNRASGNSREALRLLVQVEDLPLSDTGPKVSAVVTRCEILVGEQRFIEAIDPLQKLIAEAKDTHPNQVTWARIRLAEALYQCNRYSKSLETADSLIQQGTRGGLGPDQLMHAYLWKTRNLVHLRKYEEAAHTLTAARKVEGVSPNMRSECLDYSGLVSSKWADFLLGDESASKRKRLRQQALVFYQEARALSEESELPESDRDEARMKAASTLKSLGQTDRAVAMLRLGIEDPAALTSSDISLAKQLGSMLPPEDAVAWFQYLLDPAVHRDPTADTVTKESLGALPGSPSPRKGTPPLDLYSELAQAFIATKDLASAIECLDLAASRVSRAGDRGVVFTQLARTYAEAAGLFSDQEDVSLCMEEAEKAAKEAIAAWTEVISSGTAPDAHSAMDRIVECYRIGKLTGLREAVESIVEDLDPDTQPSKRAFSEYTLMRVMENDMPPMAEIGRRARSIWEKYKDSSKADVREIAAASLLWAVHYLISSDEFSEAEELIAEMEEAYPERYKSRATMWRRVMERHRQRAE